MHPRDVARVLRGQHHLRPRALSSARLKLVVVWLDQRVHLAAAVSQLHQSERDHAVHRVHLRPEIWGDLGRSGEIWHALLAVTPLRLSCKPADLGCECEAFKERKLRSKRLLLFDRCVGGIGLTERVATGMPELLRSALELMTSCDCDDGCWLCVHSSVCTEYNACTSKKAAIAVIEGLLAAPPPPPPPLGAGSSGAPKAEPRAPPPGSSEEAPSMLGRSIGIFRSMAMSQSRSRGGST